MLKVNRSTPESISRKKMKKSWSHIWSKTSWVRQTIESKVIVQPQKLKHKLAKNVFQHKVKAKSHEHND